MDISLIDPTLDCRAVTPENPTGARGAGGAAAGGRKGSPMRLLKPGRTLVLAEVEGPGTIRHAWMTVPESPPEVLRSLVLEIIYGTGDEPSVSVPLLDFFGSPHGRPVAFTSAVHALQEGRGLNSYLPVPFGREGVRITLTNHSPAELMVFYQFDLTLERDAPAGYLHATFRRENPTVLLRDFEVVDGLRGPGRFVGMVGGVRTLDEGSWYGEGEVKFFRDRDTDLPTICGTGLEDYVGSAWGLGAHASLYGGAPLVAPPFVGFYRWHVLDPIMFERELRVTVQQIGSSVFSSDEEDEFRDFTARRRPAGAGWVEHPSPEVRAFCMYERSDDYCATAFLYCREPQPVPPVDVKAAVADL